MLRLELGHVDLPERAAFRLVLSQHGTQRIFEQPPSGQDLARQGFWRIWAEAGACKDEQEQGGVPDIDDRGYIGGGCHYALHAFPVLRQSAATPEE